MDTQNSIFIECDSDISWSMEDYLRFCEDGRSIILIGYRVILTPIEYNILNLLNEETHGVDAHKIIEKCFLHKDVTVGNVAVHIYNVNKKAQPITGRRLIYGNKTRGYRIVENI